MKRYIILVLLAAWLSAPPVPKWQDGCPKDLPEACRNARESVEERPWPPIPAHVCDKGGGGKFCGER